MHSAVGHARQDAVGLLLDLGDGRLDDHRLHSAAAERIRQVAVNALLASERVLSSQAVALFALQKSAIVEPALGVQALLAELVASSMRCRGLAGGFGQTLAFGRQRLRLLAKLRAAL